MINIDYFLDEIMDADHISEIFDYFNPAETDKIEAALEDLGEDDYSETEVRLVRVKFLPEIGNYTNDIKIINPQKEIPSEGFLCLLISL